MSSATTSDQSKKTNPFVLTTKKDVQPSQGWIRQLGDHDITNESLDSIKNDSQVVTPEQAAQLNKQTLLSSEDQQNSAPTMNESWNAWLQPKAEPSQIEFQPYPNGAIKPQPEKPIVNEFKEREPSIHEIKQNLHNAEVKTVLLAADILDTIQKENKVNAAGFAAEGRLPINPESENKQEIFENEITAPPPENPAERYLFERPEPVQEFKQEVNISRPLAMVDFGYFFNWAGGGVREISKPVVGMIKSFFGGLFSAMGTLGKKEVFFRSKKEQTSEEQIKELKQNQNKTNFFEGLKNNARMFLGLDRKRSLKQQIESTNLQAGVSNVSYEGIIDPSGQIRENVASAAEKGSSQKSAEQAKNDKQRSLMFSAKGKSKTGPGISFSTDKSPNFNNVAKLSG